MQIGALSSVSGDVAGDRTGPSAAKTMSRQDFLNLMVNEITHQDPMNPVDNQDFLNQLSQIESMRATTSLTQGIENLIALQQIGSASSLIGLSVEGEGPDGTDISGTVEKILLQGNEVSLIVEGRELPLNMVREVQGRAVGV